MLSAEKLLKYLGWGSEAFNVPCEVWFCSTMSRTLLLPSKIYTGSTAVNVCSDGLAEDITPLKFRFNDMMETHQPCSLGTWNSLVPAYQMHLRYQNATFWKSMWPFS